MLVFGCVVRHLFSGLRSEIGARALEMASFADMPMFVLFCRVIGRTGKWSRYSDSYRFGGVTGLFFGRDAGFIEIG